MGPGQKEILKKGLIYNTIAPLAASRLTQGVMPDEIFKKSKPEYVMPMTLYLCSDRCPVTGNIYNAGMGFFNRVAIAIDQLVDYLFEHSELSNLTIFRYFTQNRHDCSFDERIPEYISRTKETIKFFTLSNFVDAKE